MQISSILCHTGICVDCYSLTKCSQKQSLFSSTLLPYILRILTYVSIFRSTHLSGGKNTIDQNSKQTLKISELFDCSISFSKTRIYFETSGQRFLAVQHLSNLGTIEKYGKHTLGYSTKTDINQITSTGVVLKVSLHFLQFIEKFQLQVK